MHIQLSQLRIQVCGVAGLLYESRVAVYLFKYCPARTGCDPVKASSIGLFRCPWMLLFLTDQSSCYFLLPSCFHSFLLEKGYCLLQGLRQNLRPCGIHHDGLHLKNLTSRTSALSVRVLNFLALKMKHSQLLTLKSKLCLLLDIPYI